MEKARSYRKYSTAFLYVFVHAFADANKQKIIPAPVLLDSCSLQYRHLHRNYNKIIKYLELVHNNGKDYSKEERALYYEFSQIDRRLKANLGRLGRLPVKSLEDITLR